MVQEGSIKDLKGSIQVLSTRKIPLEAPKEEVRKPLRVVSKVEKTTLVFEFHESPRPYHMGTQANFEKLKEKYW